MSEVIRRNISYSQGTISFLRVVPGSELRIEPVETFTPIPGDKKETRFRGNDPSKHPKEISAKEMKKDRRRDWYIYHY